MTRTLVMKFGGAAVASVERFAEIAAIVMRRSSEYERIVVVVSAMGDTTDELIDLAYRVHPNPPRRELDMLVSVGERISISLLAMALDKQGKEAISFTGSQSGIITTAEHSDARIIEVRPLRILQHLQEGKIVIVAGFQGVSRGGEITTLGRGGSDTTAVALGVALFADKVEFYKDVPGIFEDDPKKNPQSRFFTQMEYAQAHEVIRKGAKVLHDRSVFLAEKNGLPLHVLPFLGDHEAQGTLIGRIPRVNNSEPLYEEPVGVNGGVSG